jgi:hypothetical protein
MNEENTNKLFLRNIYELLGEAFYIPAYQRGYRWSSIQVKELLDDVWEYSQQKSTEKSAFYCLQPIVVVRDESSWQVVDGQQRLTTLYLILHYLEQEHLRRPLSDAFKKSLYTIQYETRPESEAFLKNVHAEPETENIDFFHMAEAYKAVKHWFEEKDYNDNNQLLETLLAKAPDAESVKVIWYDLSDECEGNEYAIDVFSRINIGKIPLTNAELVKALFLQSSHFQKGHVSLRQLHIASEWDAIEKQLQEPEFWHFMYRSDFGKRYPTRIEYIFDLMKWKKSGDEAFFTFHKFNADFKESGANIDQLWQAVKNYFLTFDEWYRDRELYHLIGFLVDCGHSVAELKSQSEVDGATKSEFKAYLCREIRNKVNCQLDGLSYGDPKIKKVLLLFNIQTLLSTKEADVRFPFYRYKDDRWDIEHIRSQADKMPSGGHVKEWLDDVKGALINDEPKYPDDKEIRGKLLADVGRLSDLVKIDSVEFNSLYERVRGYFNEDEASWVDGLGNLALLDAATNRSYGNAFFPVKRSRIIENDEQGVFVPICTKNVFLKYYTESIKSFNSWDESDSNDYVGKVRQVLSPYLPEQGGGDE